MKDSVKYSSINESVFVLDTNALINLTKRSAWQCTLNDLIQNFQIIVPTPVLYEFQINRKKLDSNQQELSNLLKRQPGKEMFELITNLQHKTLPCGLYIVNPTHMEWTAATHRMAQHIEDRKLESNGIKNRHMDHLIYSVCRNLFGSVCTDNEKDFLAIADIASKNQHDGVIAILSLDQLTEKLRSAIRDGTPPFGSRSPLIVPTA